MTAAVSDTEDYLKSCAKHRRAPMPGTSVVPAQAQEQAEESATVAVLRFGCTHPRVPSRSSKDARERMLAGWRAEVLADAGHRHGRQQPL